MTKEVKLYANERLDLEDAGDLQALVYEYVQRALNGILGSGSGITSMHDAQVITDGYWKHTALDYRVKLSGRCYISRSNEYHFDYGTVSQPEGKDVNSLTSGTGTGWAQVFLFDSGATHLTQESVINFNPAVADAGGIFQWLQGQLTYYSVWARRRVVDSDSEGRMYWLSEESSETQQPTMTRSSEYVEMKVAKTADADGSLKKGGWVRIFDITSTPKNDNNDALDDFGAPYMWPVMVYDHEVQNNPFYNVTKYKNGVQTCLDLADATPDGETDYATGQLHITGRGATKVGGAQFITEGTKEKDIGGGTWRLLSYIVRQLGWLQDGIAFSNRTFQRPAQNLDLVGVSTSRGGSYTEPTILYSGVIFADLQNGKWKFAHDVVANDANESVIGATVNTQGSLHGSYAGAFFTKGAFAILNDTDHLVRYTPITLATSETANLGAKAWDNNTALAGTGTTGGTNNGVDGIFPTGGGKTSHYSYDLAISYDPLKVKIQGVQATPYANIGFSGEQLANTIVPTRLMSPLDDGTWGPASESTLQNAGLDHSANAVDGEGALQSNFQAESDTLGLSMNAPIQVFVHRGVIYIKTQAGNAGGGADMSGLPLRSIELLIIGYCDDGAGANGLGSVTETSDVQKSPPEVGGTTILQTASGGNS
jgi:hypothetical protein